MPRHLPPSPPHPHLSRRRPACRHPPRPAPPHRPAPYPPFAPSAWSPPRPPPTRSQPLPPPCPSPCLAPQIPPPQRLSAITRRRRRIRRRSPGTAVVPARPAAHVPTRPGRGAAAPGPAAGGSGRSPRWRAPRHRDAPCGAAEGLRLADYAHGAAAGQVPARLGGIALLPEQRPVGAASVYLSPPSTGGASPVGAAGGRLVAAYRGGRGGPAGSRQPRRGDGIRGV